MNELHVHLDGSLRRETLNELARKNDINISRDFGFRNGMSLQQALSMFKTTVALMQNSETLTKVSRELCEDLKEDGVDYAEIRFAPHLHGNDLNKIVDDVCKGLKFNFKLILCGLYGNSPKLIEEFVDIAINNPDVVGIDVAGGPHTSHKYGLKDYEKSFLYAKDKGIGTTIHAGEGRNVKEIIAAANVLNVDRIGHGCTILDSDYAVALIKHKQIIIEACPTSNVHTGIYKNIKEHPVKEWIKNEIPVVVCADNLLMSRTTTSREIIDCNLTSDEKLWIEQSGLKGRFYKEDSYEKRITR